jgi:hypothetical protein
MRKEKIKDDPFNNRQDLFPTLQGFQRSGVLREKGDSQSGKGRHEE